MEDKALLNTLADTFTKSNVERLNKTLGDVEALTNYLSFQDHLEWRQKHRSTRE